MKRDARIALLIVVLIMAFGVAGCQNKAAQTPAAAGPETARPAPTLPPVEGLSDATIANNCTVTSLAANSPTQPSAYPSVRDTDLAFGPADAPVTLVEYSNFLCGHCSALDITLADLRRDYPNDLRIVLRHYPFRGQENAALAAQAVEAAALQDVEKAYILKSYLFRSTNEWKDLSLDQLTGWLSEQAVTLELDGARFSEDLNSTAVKKKISADQVEARSLNIPGTPFVIINGKAYAGPRDYASLETIINLNKLEELQYAECPPLMIAEGKSYTATLVTSKGNVLIELYPDQAPVTVNNFVFLARNGWYDGIIFHRVLPGFVAQAGDPSATGYGNPGYAFADEIGSLRFDQPGVLAMANSGPNTNGSQFFITYAAQPDLNGKYTIFGRVIQGMDVLKYLTPRDPAAGSPIASADRIESVTIEEK
jgi:cyclophilin family peptidyl-prolyl cis-trans isomerase/protein-disulfide isomerase